MLDSAWTIHITTRRSLILICPPFRAFAIMTLDEKIRFGMIALGASSIVFATLGVHFNPLDIAGGFGSG